jgi:hypothetical protein
MSNGGGKRAKRRAAPVPVPAVDRTPSWSVVYYRASDGTVPALEFLDGCPGKLEGEFTAVLDALTGPGREQFRLFCLLENASDEELRRRGLTKPAIAVLDGRRKPWRTVLSTADYRAVKKLGEEHKRQHPRRIAS